jgi:hypothetical protein
MAYWRVKLIVTMTIQCTIYRTFLQDFLFKTIWILKGEMNNFTTLSWFIYSNNHCYKQSLKKKSPVIFFITKDIII